MSGLWCDKYRPLSLSQLDYNREQAECIKQMIKGNDFPHLLIYGALGSGRATRIRCIIRELFGDSVDNTRHDYITLETPSKRKLDLVIVTSNYHVEVNPSDLGIYDRLVIQDVMKSIAQSGGLVSSVPFKVVIVLDAHKLSREAQHSLRRTMEKYYSSLRLILSADTSSSIIPPIKSRCLLLRVAAPSHEKIAGILLKVAKEENFTIDTELSEKIAKASGRNLRRALLMMETMHINGTREIIKPSYVFQIQSAAKKLIDQPTLDRMREIRETLYEVAGQFVPYETIFTILIKSLISSGLLDSAMKAKLLKLASYYEYKMSIGSKRMVHLEAFASHFMSDNQVYQEDLMKSLENDVMEGDSMDSIEI